MKHQWTADIVVHPELARSVIEAQFPSLAPAAIEALGNGWDNTVFRVNERFAFRFPRRDIAVNLIQTEIACLPVLAPRLPFPIPIPLFAGRPSPEYPWPFAGYTYIDGDRRHLGTPDMAWRRRLAAALGEFLKTLHAIPIGDLPVDAIPLDELARLDMASRRAAMESRVALLQSAGLVAHPEAILALVDQAPDPPSERDLVIVHGDLHAGQLVVGADGRLAGVIDWGDLHFGHRAVDLVAVHQLIPPALFDAFFASYGDVDDVTWRLARARAAWHGVALLASAADSADERMVAESKMALAFLRSG